MISKSNCYTFVIFFFVLITFLINKFENLNTINYELLYQLWFRTISRTNNFQGSVDSYNNHFEMSYGLHWFNGFGLNNEFKTDRLKRKKRAILKFQ